MNKVIRKSTNLSLDKELVRKSKELGISLSRAAEEGITLAVKKEMERRWKAENQEAVRALNGYIDSNGLPLSKYRQF